jgi:AAA+ superfamily predicted ATPase
MKIPHHGRSTRHIGTGKTMLVKAVANSTTASFIRVVGSEFVQKYLGEVNPLFPSNSSQAHNLY